MNFQELVLILQSFTHPDKLGEIPNILIRPSSQEPIVIEALTALTGPFVEIWSNEVRGPCEDFYSLDLYVIHFTDHDLYVGFHMQQKTKYSTPDSIWESLGDEYKWGVKYRQMEPQQTTIYVEKVDV